MKVVKSLALIMALAVTGLAFTAARDEIRRELEAVYAKIETAMKAKDIAALEALLDEGYEKTSGKETFDRAQTIARMRQNLDMTKSIDEVEMTIDKIEQVEGNYIVDYTQKVKGTLVIEGKEEAFDITSKGRDWWVKNDDGKWICVGAESIED